MEYIDVIDAQGNLTGERQSRADIHKNGTWHRAVHCWLINSNQELLLQKRTLNKETNAGMWDISIAGHVPAGLTPVEALIKEAQEELGLKLVPENVEHLFTIKQQSIHQGGRYLNNEINDVFLVGCDQKVSDFTLQEDEVAAVVWIPLDLLTQRVVEKDPTLVLHAEYQRLFAILRNKTSYR